MRWEVGGDCWVSDVCEGGSVTDFCEGGDVGGEVLSWCSLEISSQ